VNQETKVLKNASWYVAGSTIQGLTPFLLTPFLTRALSETEFSQFVLFIAIGTILSFLFALGLPAALTRELILDKNNSVTNLESTNYIKRYLIVVGFFLLVVSFFSTDITKILLLAFALAISLAIVQIDMAIYRAQQKAKIFIFLAISSTALPTIFMTLGIYFNLLNNVFIVFYAVFVFIFATLANLKAVLAKSNSKKLPYLFKLGSPTIPHGLGMSLMQYGDRIVIAGALGLTAAGRVQVAALLGTASLLLLSTLNHAWIPAVLEKFNQNKKSGVEFLNKSTNLMSLLIFNISLFIMFLNPWILKIFAPATFDLAALSPVVLLMALAANVFIFYLRNTHVLTFLGKFQSLAWITPISILLQIALIFALVPFFGLVSVAFALLAMVSSQAILTQIVVRRLDREINLTFAPIIYIVLLSVIVIFLLN
jgi:O-antigen/teichoic acid export membrane protein